jgi:hypothetical protein
MIAVERSLPLLDVLVLTSLVGAGSAVLRRLRGHRGRGPRFEPSPGPGARTHVRVVRMPYDWQADGE